MTKDQKQAVEKSIREMIENAIADVDHLHFLSFNLIRKDADMGIVESWEHNAEVVKIQKRLCKEYGVTVDKRTAMIRPGEQHYR